MQPRRNPLVASILAVVAHIGALKAGIQPGLVPAHQLKLDGVWKGPNYYPRSQFNGSAKVRRAAQKRRNVLRNRRAHR